MKIYKTTFLFILAILYLSFTNGSSESSTNSDTESSVSPSLNLTRAHNRLGMTQRNISRNSSSSKEEPKPEIPALQIAATRGQLEDVKAIINNGENIDEVDHSGATALMKAAENNHLEVARFLCEKGAKVNAVDRDGITALMLATSNESIEMIKLLCEKGAIINMYDNQRKAARDYTNDFEIRSFLHHFNHPRPNNEMGIIGKIRRYCAEYGCRRGRTGFEEYNMMEAAERNYGDTALIMATRKNQTEIAKLLIDRKANVNAVDRKGFTPLILAATNGNYEIAYHLCINNADVNILHRETGMKAFDYVINDKIKNLLRQVESWEIWHMKSPAFDSYLQWLPQEMNQDTLEFVGTENPQ